jgi:hypothetical protein
MHDECDDVHLHDRRHHGATMALTGEIVTAPG